MRRYLLLIAMVVYSALQSYAQENINMIEILNIKNDDIVALENRITYLLKKNPATTNIQGLRQFHILMLGFPEKFDYKKENYLDHSFLYQLKYYYYDVRSNCLFGRRKKVIRTDTMITDSIGNLVATGDARLITPFNKDSYWAFIDMKLATILFNNEIDYVIYFIILSLLVLSGCVYDPPRGVLYITNNSDEAIYIYRVDGDVDSLPSSPKLVLFTYYNNDDGRVVDASGNPFKSGYSSPDYRVNAYDNKGLRVAGTSSRPKLCWDYSIEEATIFFITETTMRNYDWDEIYKNQMYAQRVLVTEEELVKNNWLYIRTT